jgi:hypothetical protein
MISVLIFFGGVCQYIAGIMEFVSGNTFGATVFSSYGAFNISYSMIYLPGSGIIAAYTDPASGELSPEFTQSIALYLWAWFILTVVFTIGAVRSSWVLLLDLLALDVALLLLAAGNMVGSQSVITAGYAFGYLVAALSCKPKDRLFYPCEVLTCSLPSRLGRLCWSVFRWNNSVRDSRLSASEAGVREERNGMEQRSRSVSPR